MLPTPGGLLKWGNTYNNDFLHWLTEGSDPDAWPVVMAFYCTPFDWLRYGGGIVQFLADVCTQRHHDLGAWDQIERHPIGTRRGWFSERGAHRLENHPPPPADVVPAAALSAADE